MSEEKNKTMADAFGRSVEGLTFTQKAFQEAEGLFRFLGGTTPPEVFALSKKAHAIIDTYIDRPEQEKECLRALAVIDAAHEQVGGFYLFDDMTRYSTLYSPQFSDMAHDLMEHKETPDTAQIMIALTVAYAQSQMEELNTMRNNNDPMLKKINFAATRQNTEALLTALKSRPYADTAPALLAKLEETINKLIGKMGEALSQEPKLTPN